MPETAAPRQFPLFLFVYALAAAGGAVAYVPFLTILLPMLVAELAGEAQITWLAYATLAGAGSASIANIAFGWMSDRASSRKPFVLAGLISSCLVLGGFSLVTELAWLIGLLALWQVALNMMLAPLAAWAGDTIPDHQKGLLGGLLAFSPAAGALVAVLITLPGLAGPEARLWMVAGIVAACVLPLLVFGAPRPFPELQAIRLPAVPPSAEGAPADQSRSKVIGMWIARLLMQVSEAALFAFLYFWFSTVDPGMTDARVAQIFAIILVLAVPLALLAGNWSDRRQRPFLPLPIAAAISTIGLVTMALAPSLPVALAGYVIFGLATSVFLALHTGQTLRVLPRPQNRGRDLGIFNLTNTVPSLIMPWLTLTLVPAFGFSGLFYSLALCTATAGLLLTLILLRR